MPLFIMFMSSHNFYSRLAFSRIYQQQNVKSQVVNINTLGIEGHVVLGMAET